MKYLRKFATEADVEIDVAPCVAFVAKSKRMIYEPLPKNGVYVQHIDGKLYTTEDWSAKGFVNDEANGVAVLSNEASFVIAKKDVSTSNLAWGGFGYIVPNVLTTPYIASAKEDYDGVTNTQQLIAQLNGYTDSGGVVGAPAAEACAAYTFPNGAKGYLPSLGEWNVAYNNKEAIISAMSIIGGTQINNKQYESYWTSTQADERNCWRIQWLDAGFKLVYKSNPYHVRAFTTL